MLGQGAKIVNAIDNMRSINAVLEFAKSRNDESSNKAIKSYNNYLKIIITFIFILNVVLFIGLYSISNYYKQLNNPSDLQYSEVVSGTIHIKYRYIVYYKFGFKEIPIPNSILSNDFEYEDGDKVNIFLNKDLEPIFINKEHNVNVAYVIFVFSSIVLFIVGIIICSFVLKDFSNYKMWYVYVVLPIVNEPNFSNIVKNYQYYKLDFSTKCLNTKESKELRKAKKIQIICLIAALIEILLFCFIKSYYSDTFFSKGLSTTDIIEFTIISIPIIIIGIRADHKARKLMGIVAKQNYSRISTKADSKII